MKLLKELRKKHGKTRKELEIATGCKSPQAYSNLEECARYYTIKQILDIYAVFNDVTGSGAAEFVEKLKKESK